MKTSLGVLATMVVLALPASAQTTGLQDPLLDRLIGEWVMEGMIAGDQITHDLVFEWVLAHNYVRFHEVARERDSTGAPAYEAIVFIGWDEPSGRYACLWLDVTGGGGLTAGGIGHAEPSVDTLAFFFRFPDGSPWHTTFAYERDTDTWNWLMQGEEDGALTSPFAQVTLSRKR